MPKLSEAELLARDAERDLGAELLESICEMKAGKVGRVSVMGKKIDIEAVAKAIEADAGEALPDLRQALKEAQGAVDA